MAQIWAAKPPRFLNLYEECVNFPDVFSKGPNTPPAQAPKRIWVNPPSIVF
jgi:hypothetical protein